MPDLSIQKKAKRLRIYITERDRWRGNSLDSALIETLRDKGIAGATVFRGIIGYGTNSSVHTIHIEVRMTDLPLVIEAIDSPEKIDLVIKDIYPMVQEGLITIDDVEIIKSTHRCLNPLPANKLVSEVMTQSVVVLQPEMSVQEAWTQMLKNKVKATPVVDHSGKVVGMLTNEDLLERAGVQLRFSVAIRLEAREINQELKNLENSRLTVQDVMTQPVVTVSENETLGAATARMVKAGLKRLPVVNRDGVLVGVLSRLDILRQVANTKFDSPSQEISLGVVKTISDIMSREIPMVNQDDNLSLIVDKFAKSDSHRLIVVDSQGVAIGLLSDSDVVARVQPTKRRGILNALKSLGKPPAGKETAYDLMSPGPLTIKPETSIIDGLRIMLAESRKWMVVVDDQDHPLGLVDRQMMLEAVAVQEKNDI